MNVREILIRCDRVQKSLPYKIIASAAIVLLAIAAFVVYLVKAQAPEVVPLQAPTAAVAPEAPAGTQAGTVSEEQLKAAEESRKSMESAEQILTGLARARYGAGAAAIAIGAFALVWLVVVWLGISLTYLGLTAVAVLIAYPMSRVKGLRSYATVLVGVVVLAQAFTALIAALKIILSDNPVTDFFATITRPAKSLTGKQQARVFPLPTDASVRSIAYKTVVEALRMRVSLILIVILIIALAALPLALDEKTPLRYRVQSFLQWGTGGSFWLIAILTLLFGCASVAFEQRDRQIWQTMTKPVSSAQYILGKWLGLIGVNAVLLGVCCTGILLFTEYLRNQQAVGEQGRSATVVAGQITEDRLLLESQILQARVAVEPQVELRQDDPEFIDKWVKPYIEEGQKRDPTFGADQGTFDRIKSDLYKQITGAERAIPPGMGRSFVFKGLGEAKGKNQLLTIRYRIDAGSNEPDKLYKITFVFGGIPTPPRDVGLGPTHTMPIYPQVIADDGTLTMEVYNGGVYFREDGQVVVSPNPDTCQFPKGGLEVSYAAGSFQANFLRVAFILWIKLAFLAMLAVTAATFLSFPVACLVAFSTFLCAEGTSFLANSLEYYDAVDEGHKVEAWKVFIRAVGLWITWIFKTYADLKPTTRLVDGRLLSWGSMAWGASLLGLWSLVLYGIAVSIFRKRELATYSGQ